MPRKECHSIKNEKKANYDKGTSSFWAPKTKIRAASFSHKMEKRRFFLPPSPPHNYEYLGR